MGHLGGSGKRIDERHSPLALNEACVIGIQFLMFDALQSLRLDAESLFGQEVLRLGNGNIWFGQALRGSRSTSGASAERRLHACEHARAFLRVGPHAQDGRDGRAKIRIVWVINGIPFGEGFRLFEVSRHQGLAQCGKTNAPVEPLFTPFQQRLSISNVVGFTAKIRHTYRRPEFRHFEPLRAVRDDGLLVLDGFGCEIRNPPHRHEAIDKKTQRWLGASRRESRAGGVVHNLARPDLHHLDTRQVILTYTRSLIRAFDAIRSLFVQPRFHLTER